MNLPVFRHLVLAILVVGVWLAAPAHVQAQDCGGGGDSGGGDPSGGSDSGGGVVDQGGGLGADQGGGGPGAFTDTPDPNWDSIMTTWNFFAKTYDPKTGAPVVVTVNGNPSVYAGSPTVVSSSAAFADGPIIAHSIEYINADSPGLWTTDITYPFNEDATENSSNRSLNITYPSPGTYYVRGGASVLFSDGQNPWIYSDQETVTVNDPITPETVSIQTHPKPGMEKWVLSSHLVEKTISVFHSN
jgi:hypothetical protein